MSVGRTSRSASRVSRLSSGAISGTRTSIISVPRHVAPGSVMCSRLIPVSMSRFFPSSSLIRYEGTGSLTRLPSRTPGATTSYGQLQVPSGMMYISTRTFLLLCDGNGGHLCAPTGAGAPTTAGTGEQAPEVVPHQVGHEDHQGDGDARCGRDPPGLRDVVDARTEVRAPLRRGRPDAETEEVE